VNWSEILENSNLNLKLFFNHNLFKLECKECMFLTSVFILKNSLRKSCPEKETRDE